jgi:hypothetical protein
LEQSPGPMTYCLALAWLSLSPLEPHLSSASVPERASFYNKVSLTITRSSMNGPIHS